MLTWLLIGCSLLCSQSGASLLVDTTLDNDYNSQISIPGLLGPEDQAVGGQALPGAGLDQTRLLLFDRLVHRKIY